MKRYKVLKPYSNRKVGDVIEYERSSSASQLIVADAVALELGVLEELRSGREQVIEELVTALYQNNGYKCVAEIALDFFAARYDAVVGVTSGLVQPGVLRTALFGEGES